MNLKPDPHARTFLPMSTTSCGKPFGASPRSATLPWKLSPPTSAPSSNRDLVQARSGDAWYRTRKFLRRYRMSVTAAALVIASLSAGLYVANRERAIAQRRFVDVRQLANKLFDIDVQARQFSGSTKTRQLIVDTSLEYLRRLAADVRGDPELTLEVGNAYMRVARVQGVPISPNLGQMDQAEQNLRIAQGYIDSVLLSQPQNRTALLRSAQIAHDRMILARLNGAHDTEALAFARKSAQRLEEFHAKSSDKPEASAILVTYLNVAQQYMLAEQFDEALRLCTHATDLARAFDSRHLADFIRVRARVFQQRGDLDEALQTIRESVKLLDPGPGNSDHGQTNNFVLALIHEGRILGDDNTISLGRTEEAVASLQRAFRTADDLVHQDPNDQSSRGFLAMGGIKLADILRHSDAPRAVAVYDHTLRHLAEVTNNPSFRRYEVNALAGSSYALRRLGRVVEARQRLDAAFERLTQLKLYPSSRVELGSEAEETLRALADYEAGNGSLPRAIEIYRKLLDQIQASKPTPETSLADTLGLSKIYRAEALLQRRVGQADLASTLEARRRDLWQHWDRKLLHNAFVRCQLDEE
jgi:tetratricopeptide (TPR) repeat protein